MHAMSFRPVHKSAVNRSTAGTFASNFARLRMILRMKLL